MRCAGTFALLTILLSLAGCLPSSLNQAETDGTDPLVEPGGVPRLDFPRLTTTDVLASCPGRATDPIVSFQVLPVPNLSEPPPGLPFRDPIFASCLVRVTDRHSDLSPDDPSGGIKNEYSRVESFNADGILLLARSIEARWYVYDASTLEPLAELPIAVEPRWDPHDPAGLYSFDEVRLMRLDLTAGTQSLVHDFASDFPDQDLAAVWTRHEGNPSSDGRTWGLLAQDQEWRSVALLVYDLHQDRLIARRDLSGDPSIDSVTISPLGTYLLVYHDEVCQDGQIGDPDHPCGLMVYDSSLQTGRSLLPIIGHSDTAVDAAGREVLIFQDVQQDQVSMLDLATGEITPLFAIDFSHSPIGLHFSGRATHRPGWAVISTYSGASPSATWMDDQVFVIELKPGGRVIRLAHTHSIVDEQQEHDYWAEPHASANQDLTRIVFTSNWGRSGTDQVEMYMIVLPDGWLERAQ